MSPVLVFITPFLARKGDGGIVETVVGHRRYRSGAEVLRQSPWQERGRGMVEALSGTDAGLPLAAPHEAHRYLPVVLHVKQPAELVRRVGLDQRDAVLAQGR